MKKAMIAICGILAVGFAVMTVYSGRQLWEIRADYAAEAEMHRLMLQYSPNSVPEQESEAEGTFVNHSIADLQEKYSDAVGWLTVPQTEIDYPFVQYKDNDYYLYRNINGEVSEAGTIFMDYRCRNDFASPNTILYGHHMHNGSVFGTLNHFSERDFFNENRSGVIYLKEETLPLEFFACMVVESEDEEIYNPIRSERYLEYVKQHARHFRDIELTDENRIVTLSTCSYEFENARVVLLAKISQE